MRTEALLVLIPVLLPLAAAAIVMMLRRAPLVQRTLMEATSLAVLVAAVLLLLHVERAGTLAVTFGGWSIPFGIGFTADRLGAVLAAITSAIALATAIYARADIGPRRRRAGFDGLFLAMIGAVNGAFLTGDLFNLYVWFELMLVAALGLLVLDRRRTQIDGAFRYAAMSILGAGAMLLGIALVFGATGTLNMADMGRVVAERGITTGLSVGAFLLLAGFGVKAAFFPLFFGLTASYHTAPTAASAAFAGLLTKVGFYACLRVFTTIFPVGTIGGLQPLLLGVAALTMAIGVMGAAAQWDVRRILAFHIVSQIGYMLMALAIAGVVGITAAIFYVVHHILVKTNLFFAAGAIKRATRTYDLKRSGGLMSAQPLFAFLFAVPALSLAGIPPLSGFWAKFFVIDAGFREGHGWLAVVALAVGFLTLFSMSKIWVEAFWKSPKSKRVPRPVPVAMMAAIGLLGALTIAVSLLIGPVADFAERAAVDMVPAAVERAAP